MDRSDPVGEWILGEPEAPEGNAYGSEVSDQTNGFWSWNVTTDLSQGQQQLSFFLVVTPRDSERMS